MAYVYRITVQTCPQFGFVEKDVGGRVHTFEGRANSAAHAAEIGDLIAQAFGKNPVSWNSRCIGVEELRS